MPREVAVEDRVVGPGHPIFVVAEIGINHNGDLGIAKELIDVAASTGCDAVKFQTRNPDVCVPEAEKPKLRDTPWGEMTYLDYRKRLEFSYEQLADLQAYARAQHLVFFSSPWDLDSLNVLTSLGVPVVKIASASLTDRTLLQEATRSGVPVMLSTGMSTLEEIDSAVELCSRDSLLLAHATSAYPCPPKELNLRMIPALSERYDVVVGYSGHEVGIPTSVAAVALGACFVERHITLSRAMWGTDQSASVEPNGLGKLVRDIRTLEMALGDGTKVVYESELPIRAKLRRVG